MYCLSSTCRTLPAVRLHIISINYLTQLSLFWDGEAIGVSRLIESILNIYHVLIFINLLYFILSLTENLLFVHLRELLLAIVKWLHAELLSSTDVGCHVRPWDELNRLLFFLVGFWEHLFGLPGASAMLEKIAFYLIDLVLWLFVIWLVVKCAICCWLL